MRTDTIKMIIVDDHPIFRRGLAEILSAEPNFEIVGEASNGARALELVEQCSPDVVILDLDIPILDGIEVAKIINARRTPVKVIFLTMHRNQSVVRSMSRLGIGGYVLKDAVMDEIVECIRAVSRGEAFLSSGLRNSSPSGTKVKAKPSSSVDLSRLSRTEKRILSEIAQSRTNREIAEALFISVRTVETHRYNICTKLGIRGPHALVKFAIENKELILTEENLSTSSNDIQ